MYGRREGFGRGDFGRRDLDFDKPKPVKIGEEYDVKITDVGAKGDGIAKIENFIVFVAGVKKGENCRIKIKEVSSRFAVGEKVSTGKEEVTEESAGKETEATEETKETEEEYAETKEESEEE